MRTNFEQTGRRPAAVVLAGMLLIFAVGCGGASEEVAAVEGDPAVASGADPAPMPAPSTVATAGLRRVSTETVCMVNDQVFEREQIPVVVEEKTYYGCCEMCEQRLAQDPASRTATDPVSGEPVDKATAVIAARPDGSVLYFASEENLKAYEERSAG